MEGRSQLYCANELDIEMMRRSSCWVKCIGRSHWKAFSTKTGRNLIGAFHNIRRPTHGVFDTVIVCACVYIEYDGVSTMTHLVRFIGRE